MAGVDLIPVHYRGGGLGLVDLLGGQVQVMFEGVASTIEYIKVGKLRALAVTSATRAAVVADPIAKARLNGLGIESMSMAPADFQKFMAGEVEKWSKVIKFAGIKPE